MRRLIRSFCVVSAVAGIVAGAGSAFAESRLFSVRTDQAGVTIVQTAYNGKLLAVAGQNGDATFFRVDNPAGAVPCANRFRFTASNGRNVETNVDLCASNWQLTVGVGANAGGGGVGAPQGGQPVVITTDDRNVTINEVYLTGKKVTISGRQNPYVQIMIPPGQQGFECSRDLGLVLSDGRRIARLVDVCQSNFLVVVALVGGPKPPPPPPSMRPVVTGQLRPQPLPTPQLEPLPAPEPQFPGTEVDPSMQWLFSATGASASFAYAIPETDASEFTAVCTLRSSKVTITLTRTADELGPGGKVLVRFAAGTFAKTYTATGSPVSELDGASHPVLQIATSDPLWVALIKESVLGIAVGSAPPYGISLKGSAVQAKQFLAACSPPPVVVVVPQPLPVPQPAPPTGGGVSIAYACEDGSFITVTFEGSQALVSEEGAPPIVLFATPSQGGQRYVGGLSELIGEGEQISWSRDGDFPRMCAPNG